MDRRFHVVYAGLSYIPESYIPDTIVFPPKKLQEDNVYLYLLTCVLHVWAESATKKKYPLQVLSKFHLGNHLVNIRKFVNAHCREWLYAYTS